MNRVIYMLNPLIEVVIQYRFPKILALNSNDPVEFQEKIKSEYPIYQLAIENQQEISFSTNEDNIPVPSVIQQQPIRNHTFISSDGIYKINLTSSFISISTLGYTRWEEMISRFENPLHAFSEIYRPPFFERIGLRYIDAFSKKKLNLEEFHWRDLIKQPWIGAFLQIDEDKMLNLGMDTEYMLNDNISRAKIHSGIGNINNDPENVFVIDSDFIHISNISITDSKKTLEYLHTNAKDFINNAITERLHNAMKPECVE